jgi:hypothetical protein
MNAVLMKARFFSRWNFHYAAGTLVKEDLQKYIKYDSAPSLASQLVGYPEWEYFRN